MPSLYRVLEDNDDGDDTATGNFDWVLSIRDKIKLYCLVFKPAAATSTPPRVLIGALAITGVGEDATDADATAFCTAAASFRSKLLAAKETTLPFVGVVVAIVVATARCTWVALSAEFKHELNNLPLTEKRFLLGNNSSEQVSVNSVLGAKTMITNK